MVGLGYCPVELLSGFEGGLSFGFLFESLLFEPLLVSSDALLSGSGDEGVFTLTVELDAGGVTLIVGWVAGVLTIIG